MLTLTPLPERGLDAIFNTTRDQPSVPITPLSSNSLDSWQKDQTPAAQSWLKSERFKGTRGQIVRIPNPEGQIKEVGFGLGPDPADYFRSNPFALGALVKSLPVGQYKLNELEEFEIDPVLACLGWANGSYGFDAFKNADQQTDRPRLDFPRGAEPSQVQRLIEAVFFVRDLVNMPANAMGPIALETACRQIASSHKADVCSIVGDDLLTSNFPLIHTVGRAAAQAPRLVELTWGEESHPTVTLVGKGVCFDSGGLNLKPGNSMTLMKKDMGGAAHVLGLSHLIMSARLPVRLRTLVPIVENSISASAFRPGDVIVSRSGQSVEIGNTDAEGRLILADALSYACEVGSEVLIDMATLTGAARTALGPDLPPFYSDDDEFSGALAKASNQVADPLWRMPLWPGYESWLDSKVADVNHIADAPMAGSITAALFLKRFISNVTTWAHFDIYAWNLKSKPGQAVGGEAQAIRALFQYLQSRFT